MCALVLAGTAAGRMGIVFDTLSARLLIGAVGLAGWVPFLVEAVAGRGRALPEPEE
ncbi:MAG: hypothetical protein HY240_03090 [Actinobacteria bacterium]|nr:hypothetical protein [Actinomycetota bacterium]